VLTLVQGRNPEWVNEVFFAEYDPEATWLHQLRPAFGDKEFFFEPELKRMRIAAMRREDDSGSRPLPVVQASPDDLDEAAAS